MKKIIALLFLALLLISPALGSAVETLPGGLLCLEEGSGYTMTVDPEDGTVEITDPDGNQFMCEVHTCEEVGLTEELLRLSFSKLVGQSQGDVAYGDRTREANGFLYIPMYYYGFLNGFAAVGGDAMLIVYIMGKEDIAAYERLLCALRPAGGEKAETPVSPAGAGAFGTEDIAGVYDIELLGEKNPDVTLILTRGGNGRMSNASSSVTFEFEVREGQILPDTDQITISRGEDGSVTIHFEGSRFRFVKRDPVAGPPRMTGKWKADKIIANGTTMDSVMLGILGLTIELTAYDDGSIDWYAVSDSVSWTAQGWGIDENGLYLYNGSRNPCTLENGSLVLSLNGDRNQQVFFTYVGPLE
ncbi:MAG: hypothetical protein IKI84_03430 [Clostridia bacterium]|nr:hypothetical protein [Clostridia bacterium]